VQEYCLEKTGGIPDIIKVPRPLRWNFKAPEGYCFYATDYKTAEVVAIAHIAGDFDMIKTLTEPDTQFALKGKKSEDGKIEYKPVRIAYNSNTDITTDKQDPKLLQPVDVPDYKRDENGKLIHPRRDVHWELAECKYFLNEPREKLDKDMHRGCGKAGNFQVPYDASPSLLERCIEVATGKKPPEGTGKKIIAAYLNKNKKVAIHLEREKDAVERVGELVSISGAKRHFHVHKDLEGMSDYLKKSLVEPLKRKACNYKIQGIVADSLAKATVKANELYRQKGLKARVVCPLYDCLYTLLPISELDEVKKIHKLSMIDFCVWDYGDRKLQFEIDEETTLRWSCTMDKNDKTEFDKFAK